MSPRPLKPCSKVFDNEPHDPHTYYHGGQDVDCLGYSPLRDPKSDDAETPEEFFRGVIEAQYFPQPKALEDNVLVQMPDPEIERLLLEEEVIEVEHKHGEKIRELWARDFTTNEIAGAIGVKEELLAEVIKAMELTKIHYTESDEFRNNGSEYTRFDQILDWWESRHQLSRDLMTIVFYLVAFTIISFVIYNITG